MSHIYLSFLFSSSFIQYGEASLWRVCHQQGIPRLVFVLSGLDLDMTGGQKDNQYKL